MAQSVFRGVQIKGVAAAVPQVTVNNLADHVFCSEEDRKKIVDLTGVMGYRKAPAHLCSSDLCVAAAQPLLEGLQIDPKSIDGIIFSTMTPDYRVPSTACVLQDRLKCSTEVVAYDINMGCSGYVVGLYNACAAMQGGGLKRVLLLAGDTQTKLCHAGDKNVVFILGDGGTATLLEANVNAEPITVELRTDGSRFQNLYVPCGGFRSPSDESSRQVRERADGGVRSDDHLYMNGMEIFKFSSTDVVKSLAGFMEAGGLLPDHISYLFLHQANKFMNDKIAGKLKFSKEKVPYSIGMYGNTGSASIPLTITHHFAGRKMSGRHRVLLCGFGVGLSWGMVDVVLDDIFTPAIVECP